MISKPHPLQRIPY